MSLSQVWTPPLLSLTMSPVVRCVCMYSNQALAQSDSQRWIFNRAFLPGCQPVPHPNGTTAQLTPYCPANTAHTFDPQSAPLIPMKGRRGMTKTTQRR